MTKLESIISLIRLDKPIGIYLVLWPALWSLFLSADGLPDIKLILIFIAGATLMRSAGCAINDYADRKIDRSVPRTSHRPLALGQLAKKDAIIVAGILIFLSFLLALNLPLLSILWSVPALVFAIIYPFTKRFFAVPQLFLGLAFAMAVPMAFFATENNSSFLVMFLVFLATVFWAIAYDTLYAMADKPYDIKIKVKSSAIFFGKYDLFFVLSFHFLSLFSLAFVGVLQQLNICFYIILSMVLIGILYQLYLAKNREPATCIKAFLFNNYQGALILAAIIIGLIK
ncbi:MAG: 4-hydroxybenzoate octaprenyltransferase [Gammaproteobacteria bacterium]|nr:MAG: 4-hydroxybenzoate octaprenyltransferase [Gammaproteobacteria bacterium]